MKGRKMGAECRNKPRPVTALLPTLALDFDVDQGRNAVLRALMHLGTSVTICT